MRDYQNLIKSLRYCASNDSEKCDTCPRINRKECNIHDLMLEEADAIEELLDELTTIRKQLPRWISVEERLPEKSKIVLVAYDNGVVAQGMLFFGKFRGANFGFDENDEPIIAEVTHWMPLPEPPNCRSMAI